MGYIKHHAIIVTVMHEKEVTTIHEKAVELFGEAVSNIIPSSFGDRSFFIGPDGSKEGWTASDEGNINRAKFIEYLDTLAYDDKSSYVSYAELYYGEDNGMSEVERHN